MANSVARIIREFWERDLPPLFTRDVSGMLKDDLIRDIVGPRRSGKTYLMFLLIREIERTNSLRSCLYLNLEDRRILHAKEETFNEIVEFIHSEKLLEEHPRVYLFLDEVQVVPGWERFARSLYDEFKGRVKIVVTGSSSNLLSEEYASLLTGRHLTRTVFPLSFSEFMIFKGADPLKADSTEKDLSVSKDLLVDYLTKGGFPEIVLSGSDIQMSSQLFIDIVARDVTSRSGIRNREAMLQLADFFARNAGNLISFGKLSRYYKSTMNPLSVPTLLKYFNIMRESFLFFDSTVWSYSVRDEKQYPRKVYCIDNSFIPDTGFGTRLENAVAIELLRRGHKLHYWRDPRHKYEVDFMIKSKEGRVIPIQVCAEMTDHLTSDREIRSLDRSMIDMGIDKSIIVTMDGSDTIHTSNGTIDVLPAWKFFLDQVVI